MAARAAPTGRTAARVDVVCPIGRKATVLGAAGGNITGFASSEFALATRQPSNRLAKVRRCAAITIPAVLAAVDRPLIAAKRCSTIPWGASSWHPLGALAEEVGLCVGRFS